MSNLAWDPVCFGGSTPTFPAAGGPPKTPSQAVTSQSPFIGQSGDPGNTGVTTTIPHPRLIQPYAQGTDTDFGSGGGGGGEEGDCTSNRFALDMWVSQIIMPCASGFAYPGVETVFFNLVTPVTQNNRLAIGTAEYIDPSGAHLWSKWR